MDRLLPYNPKNVRRILAEKDYLSGLDNKKEIRGRNLFVSIAGVPNSGKSTLCDGLVTTAQTDEFRAITARSSRDAEERYVLNRKELMRLYKEDKANWTQVVYALREEGVSGLNRKVLPHILENGKNKRNLTIFSRTPFIDTLTLQYLEGSPLRFVAKHLKGQDEEKSGYIIPDLVIILTCNGKEALLREMYTKSQERLGRPQERTTNLPANYPQMIDEQVKAYLKLAGFVNKKYDAKKQAFPVGNPATANKVYIFDTSTNMTEEKYSLENESAKSILYSLSQALKTRIYSELIKPNLEKR